jgi:hypothetical protein
MSRALVIGNPGSLSNAALTASPMIVNSCPMDDRSQRCVL